MEKLVEDMFIREKDGYFHCKTCNKKLFTKYIFEIHLKTEHSPTLKIEKDTEANNNNPIAYQDCNPHIYKNQTLNTSDMMDKPGKNSKGSKVHDLTNQSFAAKVKLEVTAKISDRMDTPMSLAFSSLTSTFLDNENIELFRPSYGLFR